MNAFRPRLVFLLGKAAPWAARGGLAGLVAGGCAIQFGWYALLPALQSALDSPALMLVGGAVGLVPAVVVLVAFLKNAAWEFHLLAFLGGPLLCALPLLLFVVASALLAPYVVGALLGLIVCGAATGSVAFLVQAVCCDTAPRVDPSLPAPTDQPVAAGARKMALGLPVWVWGGLLAGALVGAVANVRSRNERLTGRPTDPDPRAVKFVGTVDALVTYPNGVTEAELEGTTDEDVKKLAPLTTLTRLDLRRTRLTDAGLKDLAPLANLTALDLFGCPITDAGVRGLAPLTKLTTLNLGHTRVTDAGLKDLAPLTELTSLNLSGCPVTDTGARELARLLKLTTLDLRCPEVTDEGITALAPLTHLLTLRLAGPRITDAGAKELARFTRLAVLDLDAPGVTPAALGGLRTELPNCKVNGVARNAPTSTGRGPGGRPPARDFP